MKDLSRYKIKINRYDRIIAQIILPDGAFMEEKISAVKNKFENADENTVRELIAEYGQSDKAGIIKLVAKYQKQLDMLEAERERVENMLAFEKEYSMFSNICGIDEAGRGPLAGPVVAAAVILPKDAKLLYVNDSKQLSEKKREELYDVIMREAASVGIGIASPERIDEINILQADYEAMREAVSQLTPQPDILLNDAVIIPELTMKQISIIKGDAKSLSIASASIIAKVTRDRLMYEYDKLYPEYGFASNKGYGSKTHIEAIKKLGPCPIHRRTFIKNFVEENNTKEK